MKAIFLYAIVLIVMTGCQSISTPMPPTPMPMPTATVLPPTVTATPSSTLTITIKENDCSLYASKSIPYGKFAAKWIVDDQKHNQTGIVILTLDGAKQLTI